MPKLGSPGSVRGALGNERPYRERVRSARKGRGFCLCGDRVSNHCRHDVRLTASPAGKGLLLLSFSSIGKTQAVFVA